MIGDLPPLPPLLLGWRWPRGPFSMPLKTSRSPISASHMAPAYNTICGRVDALASPSTGLHDHVLTIFRASGAAARWGCPDQLERRGPQAGSR